MVELNHRERTIKVKVVYYGPPLGGKTTNLQVLHAAAEPRRRGELISVNSAQDRTILFDLLPLKTPGFRGFDLRLQLLAVPGQAVYAATRRVALKGADSLVFVANSARDRFDENVQSYREMTENLLSHHLDPAAMPLVFQYNKRDLPEVVPVEALDRSLNSRRAEAVPAVALRGDGVLETFMAILAHTLADLAKRYSILQLKEGMPVRQWAEEALVEVFGRRTLAPAPAEAPPPPSPAEFVAQPPPEESERLVVRAGPVPSEEAARPAAAFPEGRAIELVESYADTSSQLGIAVGQLREQRDAAERRLEDLRRTLQAAQEILSGTPFDAALAPVLERMAMIAGVRHASFWIPRRREPPRAVALLGVGSDPVLAAPGAVRLVAERAAHGGPALVKAEDDADLAAALDTPRARFAAVLAVPFCTPGGLQGVAAFYYGADTAQPGPCTLEHLGEMPRALSAALELAATLQTVKAAERALELALAGSVSIRGLADLVRSIEELRDGLGAIRGRSDAPPWFVERYLALAPTLGAALESARSLLGFCRGEIRREGVYIEDLFAELRTPEVSLELDPGLELIAADATLLRLALRATADELRARAGSNTAPLVIEAALRPPASARIVLGTDAKERSATAAVNAGLGLDLARRIVELHGGKLEDVGPNAVGPIVLMLPTA